MGDVNKLMKKKAVWQRSAMFCLYTSSKLSRPQFEFSLKVKLIFLTNIILTWPFSASWGFDNIVSLNRIAFSEYNQNKELVDGLFAFVFKICTYLIIVSWFLCASWCFKTASCCLLTFPTSIMSDLTVFGIKSSLWWGLQ